MYSWTVLCCHKNYKNSILTNWDVLGCRKGCIIEQHALGRLKGFSLSPSHAACQKTFSVRITGECPAPDGHWHCWAVGPYPQTPVFLKGVWVWVIFCTFHLCFSSVKVAVPLLVQPQLWQACKHEFLLALQRSHCWTDDCWMKTHWEKVCRSIFFFIN